MIHDTFPKPEDCEYLVIPAPAKGDRAAACKTDADRMANTLTIVFNEMSAMGWEYVRTERLPNDVGHDLTGTGEREVTMLVFRRLLATPVEAKPDQAPQEATIPPVSLEDTPLILTNPIKAPDAEPTPLS